MKVLTHAIMPLTQEFYELGRNEEAPLFDAPEGTVLMSLSRGAFQHVARSLKKPGCRVLVPGYTCVTVPAPFEREGWEVEYFPIDRNMRINSAAFLRLLEDFKPDAIVVHPYYGQDLNEEERTLLRKAKAQGCFIVKDLTQCIGATQKEDFVDAYTGSIRKWFPMPDGAFYYSKVLPMENGEMEEDVEFVTATRDAMYIRNLHVQTGNKVLGGIASRINKNNGEGKRRGEDVGPFRMSDFSRRILFTQDFEDYDARRQANARYLWENLKDNPLIEMAYSDISDISTGPLFFPFYVKTDNKEFSKEYLTPAQIQGVTMWRNFIEQLPADLVALEDDLYTKLLLVPIGLDYGKEEMDRIIACFRP